MSDQLTGTIQPLWFWTNHKSFRCLDSFDKAISFHYAQGVASTVYVKPYSRNTGFAISDIFKGDNLTVQKDNIFVISSILVSDQSIGTI